MEPAATSLLGQRLLDADGALFGTIVEVFDDVDERRPAWVEARSEATGESVLVPVESLHESEGEVRSAHRLVVLHAAPVVDLASGVSVEDEQRLRQHYGLEPAGRPEDAPSSGRRGAAVEHGDGVAASVVRAEEELRIETEVRPAGVVRLRKWVESQTVSEEVVVHQERVRVEREPVSLSNVDAANAVIGEAEYEVVLRDEEVVATKVTVPREVVRLAKGIVAETVVVEADLRHEEVALETSGDADEDLASSS